MNYQPGATWTAGHIIILPGLVRYCWRAKSYCFKQYTERIIQNQGTFSFHMLGTTIKPWASLVGIKLLRLIRSSILSDTRFKDQLIYPPKLNRCLREMELVPYINSLCWSAAHTVEHLCFTATYSNNNKAWSFSLMQRYKRHQSGLEIPLTTTTTGLD